MKKLKVLDLFSGIGGFSLGLERTGGFETVAFCEIDEHATNVLNKHWPLTPKFGDISKVLYSKVGTEDGNFNDYTKKFTQYYIKGGVDVICGGYPCTGHSAAGKKEGFENEGSSLWREYLRLIKECKPKYCILENSPNLRNTGLAEMLQAFNESGYNAEWQIISGYFLGAPHQRERIYIVLWRKELPYCDPFRSFRTDPKKEKSKSDRWSMRRFKRNPLYKQASKIEPKVLQFDVGISEGLSECEEKIKQLGNSIFPQIPELIGEQILKQEKEPYAG